MTFGDSAYFIQRAPAGLALCLAAALAGCASATIEDAVPQSAASATPVSGSALPAGPIDTGTYPNLNVAQAAASTQLTEAERAAKTAELQAARQTLAASGPASVSSDMEPLRRIAGSHAEEALKQIEGE